MDNSIILYDQLVQKLIAQLQRLQDMLTYHVITAPKERIENAVSYGFPEDIYVRYMYSYFSKNESQTQDIINYINSKCKPFLENVSMYLNEAMNIGGGNGMSAVLGSMAQKFPNGVIDVGKEEKFRKNNEDFAKALSIKQGCPMTIEEADQQNTNPRYELSIQYQINCVTCAAAFAMRLRGFNVIAKGNPGEGNTSSNNHIIANSKKWYHVWKNIDGSIPNPIMLTDWMSKYGIKEMSVDDYKAYFDEVCEEPGIYEVTVQWKSGSGHALILQRDTCGQLYYIEPQLYNKVSSRRSVDDLLLTMTNMQLGKQLRRQRLSSTPGYGCGVLRVDDKLFNTDYADIFEPKNN